MAIENSSVHHNLKFNKDRIKIRIINPKYDCTFNTKTNGIPSMAPNVRPAPRDGIEPV